MPATLPSPSGKLFCMHEFWYLSFWNVSTVRHIGLAHVAFDFAVKLKKSWKNIKNAPRFTEIFEKCSKISGKRRVLEKNNWPMKICWLYVFSMQKSSKLMKNRYCGLGVPRMLSGSPPPRCQNSIKIQFYSTLPSLLKNIALTSFSNTGYENIRGRSVPQQNVFENWR